MGNSYGKTNSRNGLINSLDGWDDIVILVVVLHLTDLIGLEGTLQGGVGGCYQWWWIF